MKNAISVSIDMAGKPTVKAVRGFSWTYEKLPFISATVRRRAARRRTELILFRISRSSPRHSCTLQMEMIRKLVKRAIGIYIELESLLAPGSRYRARKAEA